LYRCCVVVENKIKNFTMNPLGCLRLIFLKMLRIVKIEGISYQMITVHLKDDKAMPVTGHEGTKGCETLRVPHYLDNRLTGGGKVVRLRRRPPFTPQEDSWYSFLLEAESTPGP
jgi:hypothetical protein